MICNTGVKLVKIKLSLTPNVSLLSKHDFINFLKLSFDLLNIFDGNSKNRKFKLKIQIFIA